jgi:hypothetical protein
LGESVSVFEHSAAPKLTIGLLHDVVHSLVHCLPLASPLFHSELVHIPLWMASASLSGISMLNSCCTSSMPIINSSMHDATNLLYRHNDLHSVQAVQSEIVGEVRVGGKLSRHQYSTLSPLPVMSVPWWHPRPLYTLAKCPITSTRFPTQTHLVEVLQQIENATGDLLLPKSRR